MVLKTRDRLIEVARQLFARKGIENTTMNDIASASDKGRRTIYTYFRNKRDIFNAVIERETGKLLVKLEEIQERPISPEEKLRQYIDCRFDTMREIVSRNGSLKAGFFRDVRKVDRARRIVSSREIEILGRILSEGVEKGVFDITDVQQTAAILVHAVHGLDVPYIRDNLADQGFDKSMIKEIVNKIVTDGLRTRRNCQKQPN